MKKALSAEISLLIGATYLEEDDHGRKLRARIWPAESLARSTATIAPGCFAAHGSLLFMKQKMPMRL